MHFVLIKKYFDFGASLVVQWLRFHAANAGAWVRSLVGEVRSRMLHNMIKKYIYIFAFSLILLEITPGVITVLQYHLE